MLGYSAIALLKHYCNWSKKDLPSLLTALSSITSNHLVIVHRWIKSLEDPDNQRIEIFEVSNGGEFVLIAATRFSCLQAAIRIVPSDVNWEGGGSAISDCFSAIERFNGKSRKANSVYR